MSQAIQFYFAVKLGETWRLHKCNSPEVACEYLFGIPLRKDIQWKNLGTKKVEAVKAWRKLT